MPDPRAPVKPGDPVEFSASAWNDAVEAGIAERGRRHDRRSLAPAQSRQGAIVRVKNQTATDLPRRAVLGLSGPIFTPDTDLDAFLREVTFRGVLPTEHHVGRYAILLEPAAAGRIVRAFVAGVCQVMIDVINDEHTCAEVDPGTTAHLVSAEGGSAQILWREGDSAYPGPEQGVQWAVVRFGLNCAGGAYYY